MPKLTPEKLLANAITRLRSERATLMTRVSEIDASFGRLGSADNTLSLLVKAGKLKRINIEGERSSRYAIS